MEQLEALRQTILSNVVPLIIDGADTGSDKFSLILRLIQSGNADQLMYQKAYDSATAIEDSSERLDAMMSLLDEIEIELEQPVESEEAVTTDINENMPVTSAEVPQEQHGDVQPQAEHDDRQEEQHNDSQEQHDQ